MRCEVTNENGNGKSFSMSASVKELATALIAVQADLPTITKDRLAKGEKFSYAYVGLDTVMPEALAILNKNGLALTQTVGTAEDGTGTTLSTMLLHKSGEWLSDTQPLLLARQDPQGQGSAITYARRYGVMAALGMVADEDDDGASAKTPTPPQGEERPPQAVSHPELRDRKADDDWHPMVAKFDSTCVDCGYGIYEGDTQLYNSAAPPKQKTKHPECPEAPAQTEKAAPEQPVAAGGHAERALDEASEDE